MCTPYLRRPTKSCLTTCQVSLEPCCKIGLNVASYYKNFKISQNIHVSNQRLPNNYNFGIIVSTDKLAAFYFVCYIILKTLLTEKPPVMCTTILVLILSTGWCSSTQRKNFVTFVRFVIQSILPVTYILFRNSFLKVGNYIMVNIVPII